MVGLIGRKIGMTQIFDENGVSIPVSVVEAGPCPIVQVKTIEKDGYNAVQVAFGDVKPVRSTLPALGHFRRANLPPYRHLQEFRVDNPGDFEEGKLIDVSIFKDTVKIPGSIGMAAYPGRVLKGKKLPGRMGHKREHISNLTLVEIDTENNLLLIKGAVPGARNTILRVTASPSR
jgi:large subunit ribosomal protein L3